MITENTFQIKNRSETRAEIVIYSDIGQSPWGDSLSADMFSKELKALPKSVNQIDVRLNSPGGDVFDGVTIYNRLKQHQANVTVYVDGLAASIASIIALAGDEIIMGEGSYMMIHSPWTFAMGNARDLEETISRLDDVEEQLLSIYKRKAKIDRMELKQMLSAETWLDSTQSVEMGFADRVLIDDAPRIAASMDRATWIRKKPNLKTMDDYAISKIENVLKK